MSWDPAQYNRFGDERGRPFFELIDRVPMDERHRIAVDLGCGPGNLTAALALRWPQCSVVGIDNDGAMLASAHALSHERLRFEAGDIASWEPAAPLDVVVANASLQWVPSHREMLPRLVGHVRPGGWLAFQVPGNLDDPHHHAIRHLRECEPWRSIPEMAALPHRTHASHPATEYLDVLAPLSTAVDAWETSYVHVLHGEDPILEWVKGTALRPVLHALGTDERRAAFCDALAPMLRDAYPSRPWGTPFPFRRVFVVAQR